MTGKIKNILRGYGFIRGDYNQVEYFFHKEDYDGADWDQLCRNMPVEFEEVDRKRGPRAAHVRRIL